MDTAWQQHDTSAYVELFIKAWVDGPHRRPAEVNPQVRNELLAIASDNIRKRRAGVHLGFTFDPDQLHRIDSLKAPVLVITGSLDMPDIKLIADEFKKHGAKTVVIYGAAHMVNMEKPQAFNQKVLSFLTDN